MPEIPAGQTLLAADLEQVLALAASDLESLRGRHVFLTGCTAFFGKWLLETLLWANQRLDLELRLTALTRDPDKFLRSMPHLAERPGLRLLQGDILDFALQGVEPFDYIIHGANIPHDGTASWPARHMTAATQGTDRLFNLAARQNCQGVLLLSSGAVYGVQSPQSPPFDESGLASSMAEPCVYGNTKRFVELYAQALGRQAGVRVTSARCFAFMGAHMPLAPTNVLGSFLCNLLRGEDITIRSDGKAVRSYLYGTDLVVWLLALLLRGGASAYNVGSCNAVTLAELAALVAECGDGAVNVHILGQPAGGNAPAAYVPETSRIKAELGVEETVSLKEGLRRVLLWGYGNHLNCT